MTEVSTLVPFVRMVAATLLPSVVRGYNLNESVLPWGSTEKRHRAFFSVTLIGRNFAATRRVARNCKGTR
jgi:hypothetical protein